MSDKKNYVYLISVNEKDEDFMYGDTIIFCSMNPEIAIDEAEKYKQNNGGTYRVIRMELK